MTDAEQITHALNGRWNGRTGTARCPAHNDHSPSLSIGNGRNGKLLLRCHTGCGYPEVKAALVTLGLIPSDGAASVFPWKEMASLRVIESTEAQKAAMRAKRCWDEALPMDDTAAEAYLRSRHITCPLPQTLRFHPSCWHPSGVFLPAMVARVDGVERFAVIRTYVREDGLAKARVEPTKAMLGGVSGGAVRLTSSHGPLVVAEGIETALSLACGILPHPASIWAALSTSGMKTLILPSKPGMLIVASDGDTAGRNAASALALRAVNLGWKVSLLPAPEGLDWNDVLSLKDMSDE